MENSRNFRGPCPCNLKKLPGLRTAYFALILAVSAGCGTNSGPLPFAPAPDGNFSLDYAGRELPGSNMPAPLVSGPMPTTHRADGLPQLVKIQTTGGVPGLPLLTTRTCLLSQAPFFFEREKGLRAAVCIPGEKENQVRLLLREALTRRGTNSAAETRPEIHGADFALGIAALPRLRNYIREFGAISLSVDAGVPGGRPLDVALRGNSWRFVTGPALQIDSSDAVRLSRVFPGAGFHLLTQDERLHLIYELNRREYLFVSLSLDRAYATELGEVLARIQTDLLQEARPATPLVTELYFGDQGPRASAYVELGSFERTNIRAKVRLRGHARVELDFFLFANAVVLLPGALPGPRHELIQEGSDGTQSEYRLDDLRRHGAGPGRALSLRASLLEGDPALPLPARFSRDREIIGNPGLHPRFARREHLPLPGRACAPADFRLNEWNPFGLRAHDGRAITGGKFIELRMARACRNEAVLIFAGDLVLDPGTRFLEKDELVLFVADGAYFEKGDLIENRGLRGLQPDLRIRAGDFVLREPVPGATYVSGAPDSPYLARVHSLVRDSAGPDQFHGRGARGLRPDLAPHHAMSPGFSHPGEKPAAADRQNLPRLAEILPRGSRDARGNSIAGDEFLKLRVFAANHGTSGALRLRITPESGVERLYVLPMLRGEAPNIHPVFARNASHCFDYGDNLIPVSNFSLPNGPARYALLDAAGVPLDEISMSRTLLDRLDDAGRASYTRAFGDYWRPTHGPAAKTSHCPGTLATPGAPPSFAAFVVNTHAHDPEFRYMGSTSARLRMRGGSSTQALQDLGEIQIAPGERFRASRISGYHIIQVEDAAKPNASPLFAGQFYGSPPSLVIEGVSPRPGPGRLEWIRLCSPVNAPDGFRGDSATGALLMRDGNSEDRIIPWDFRRPAALVPFGLQGDSLNLEPGTCALVLDPDFAGGDLLITERDRALWTIASGSALGNGLASGESLRVYHSDGTPLASLGLPGTSLPWSMDSGTNEYLRRLPGTHRDAPENFTIAVIE